MKTAKTAAIIIATFMITLDFIVSIIIFNVAHVKDNQVVAKKTGASDNLSQSVPEKNLPNNTVAKKSSLVCEVIQVANEENNGYHNVVCQDGGKYGFTNNDFEDNRVHPKLKLGDPVSVTIYEDGNISVDLASE